MTIVEKKNCFITLFVLFQQKMERERKKKLLKSRIFAWVVVIIIHNVNDPEPNAKPNENFFQLIAVAFEIPHINTCNALYLFILPSFYSLKMTKRNERAKKLNENE